MLAPSSLAWSRLWSNDEMRRQRSWTSLWRARTRQVRSVWRSSQARIITNNVLGHEFWLLSYYIPGICLVCRVCDRFNRNSSADVLQQLWCLAAIDTGSSDKAAAILKTRYEISHTRYCYLPSWYHAPLICGCWNQANVWVSSNVPDFFDSSSQWDVYWNR